MDIGWIYWLDGRMSTSQSLRIKNEESLLKFIKLMTLIKIIFNHLDLSTPYKGIPWQFPSSEKA